MFISQTTDFHFANYRFSFRKLQIFISQTTDFHFANYRFSFRKLQIPISQTTDFHFANYRFPFRKVQISISQTTDSHFANYRFSFPFRFIPFRFANYSKPLFIASTRLFNYPSAGAVSVLFKGIILEGSRVKPGFHIVVSVVSVVRKKFIGQI